jgi:hypothetical protein
MKNWSYKETLNYKDPFNEKLTNVHTQYKKKSKCVLLTVIISGDHRCSHGSYRFLKFILRVITKTENLIQICF